MTSSLTTDQQRKQLLSNGQLSKGNADFDPFPVVKLFTPDSSATWLLSEIDPTDEDIAFGLCDLGLGEPELGTVSLAELERARGPLGLPVERDLWFQADKALSAYADIAIEAGRIIA